MRPVFVRRHPRRHRTPEQQVHDAERTLRRVNGGKDLDHVCYVVVSDEPSQIMAPEGGFEAGRCSVVNIEPMDQRDEVQRVTTLQHEAYHAAEINRIGAHATTEDEEIEAHHATIRFLGAWKRKERSNRLVYCTEHNREEPIRYRIDEVIAEEEGAIRSLQEGTYYE